MKYSPLLIIFFFLGILFATSGLHAQDVRQLWAKSFGTNSDAFEVMDAAMTPDGEWIGIVGYTFNGKKTTGQLLLIRTSTRERVDIFVKNRDTDNRFNGIAVSDDGLFHIVGQVSEKENGEQGWWLTYDPYTQKEVYPDKKLGEQGDQQLEKIIWLGSSTGLAIGRNTNLKDGNLWLLQIIGDRVEPYNRYEVGAEAVADIATILPYPGNDSLAWLCGTTKQSKKSPKDNSWLIEVNYKGDWNQEATFNGDNSRQESVVCAAVNRQGDLLMAGGYKKYSDESDPWMLLTLKGDKHAKPIHPPASRQDDWISALTATEDNELFMMLINSKERSADYQYFIYYTRGDLSPYNSSNTINTNPDLKLNIAPVNEFIPKRFLHPNGTDLYVLVGTSSVGGGAKLPYVVVLEGKGAKGKGAKAKLPSDKTISGKKNASTSDKPATKSKDSKQTKPTNETLPDPSKKATEPTLELDKAPVFSKNGGTPPQDVLKTNEGGSVKFTLKNTGGDMPAGGKIRVSNLNLMQGVSLKIVKEIPFSAIEQGKNSPVLSIAIRADASVVTGDSYFDIEVLSEDGSKLYLKFRSPTIRSQGAEVAQTPQKPIEFTTPSERTGEIIVETFSDNYQGKAIITTSSPNLKQSKPPKVETNFQRPRSRSTNGTLSDAKQVEGRYVHTFDFTVDLEMDTNLVFIQMPDEMGGMRSTTIKVVRKKRQPRLFMLAIGIPYDDHNILSKLDFTTKDAADFYSAMEGQSKLGFVSEIKYNKLLNRPDNTTKAAIESAFYELSTQDVRPEDFVMVFISSHGEARNNNPLILPCNYDGKPTSAVDYQSLVRLYLKGLNCKRFVFIDACHSGADGKSKADADELNRQIDIANNIAPGMISFKSSQGEQSSYEYAAGRNGVFTYALLEAIKGVPVRFCNNQGLVGDTLPIDIIDPTHPTRGKDGISVKELATFLAKRVPNLTGCLSGPHGDQVPAFSNEVSDDELIIFRVK